MKQTLKSILLASALLFAGVPASLAETVDVPKSARPTCVVEAGDVAVLTFPAGHVPARVEIYGGKGIKRIVPQGSGIVKFEPASQRWFNYVDLAGNWAFVEDGTSYKYAEGVRSEPTRAYGGRAHDGAALAPATN
ncbi:MAG: hypothetical protein WCJ25_01025 [Candidatus Moraniibacteriota bacterium]